MKISALLPPEHIFLNVSLPDKQAVLRYIADAFGRSGVVNNPDKVYEAIKAREDLMSTGIGNGIGIPHALTSEVEEVALLLMSLTPPVPFEALDGGPVDIVIALIVPRNETTLHLRTLADISGLCRKPGFLKTVRKSGDPKALRKRIREIEE